MKDLSIYVWGTVFTHREPMRYNELFGNELKDSLIDMGYSVDLILTEPTVDHEHLSGKSAIRPMDIDDIFNDYEFADKRLFCDDVIIVQNNKTKNFILINIQDSFNIIKCFLPHPKCVGVINTFYDIQTQQILFEKHDLIVPGNYFPMYPSLVENHYETISKIEPTDKRMFFSGTLGNKDYYNTINGVGRREIARVLKDKYPDEVRILDRHEKLDRVDWWKESAKHYINLALPGHPWCNREHELWALGLPILASEWVNPTINRPIPNYHYLTADGGRDREWTGTCLNIEYAADKLYNRYKQSIDNPEYLKWIGENGRDYYHKYIKPSSSAKYYSEIINKWVGL